MYVEGNATRPDFLTCVSYMGHKIVLKQSTQAECINMDVAEARIVCENNFQSQKELFFAKVDQDLFLNHGIGRFIMSEPR